MLASGLFLIHGIALRALLFLLLILLALGLLLFMLLLLFFSLSRLRLFLWLRVLLLSLRRLLFFLLRLRLLLFGLSRLFLLLRFVLLILACVSRQTDSEQHKDCRCTHDSHCFHVLPPLHLLCAGHSSIQAPARSGLYLRTSIAFWIYSLCPSPNVDASERMK